MEIDTKKFTTMIIGLVVAVVLVAGLMVPAINSLQTEENGTEGEVIDDFAEWLSFEGGMASDYYNSYQTYVKGISPNPPSMIWTKDSFKALEITDQSKYASEKYNFPIVEISIYLGNDEENKKTLSVKYLTSYSTGTGSIDLEEPAFVYSYSDLFGSFLIEDTDSFEIETTGYTVKVTYSLNGETVVTEGNITKMSYLSPNTNGWIGSTGGADANNMRVANGSSIMVVWSLSIDNGEWFDQYEIITFDDSNVVYGEGEDPSTASIENRVWADYFHELDVEYNGVDYGTCTIDIPADYLGNGLYLFGAYSDGYIFDGDTVQTADGQHTVEISGESWYSHLSIMNIDPYQSVSDSSSDNEVLMSLISVIPLITVVGIVMGAIGFLRTRGE